MLYVTHSIRRGGGVEDCAFRVEGLWFGVWVLAKVIGLSRATPLAHQQEAALYTEQVEGLRLIVWGLGFI